MWPLLLDMTKDECKRNLRRLELEAYGNIVSALRAQGGLGTDKHKLLQDVASVLNIPQERHRAEIRRAVNDERLATIAHCMTGDDTTDEWALEGRRLVPLMPRLAPQTAYSIIADDEANKVSVENEKLPLPANTERKRPLQTSTIETINKNIQHREVHFRVPSDTPSKTSIQNNVEEISTKKRKSNNLNVESSSLAQHLMMAQPKISRVQQIYRQKTKALLKNQMKHRGPPAHPQKLNVIKQEEDNVIQDVPIPAPKPAQSQHNVDINKIINQVTIPSNPIISNENHTPVPKVKPTIISNTIIKTCGPVSSTNSLPNNSGAGQAIPVASSITNLESTPQKSIKICPARKVITTMARTPSTHKNVIIVSQAPGTTSSSILQRTLSSISSIPFVKTISMKNLDKVKVINAPGSGGTSTTPQKPKLLTVQTKTKGGVPGKQVSIPFIQGVQLQALQNKGAIKMVPFTNSTKIVSSKAGFINTTAGSVYIMNSNNNTNVPVVTASTISPVVSTKTSSEIAAIEISTKSSDILPINSNIIILKNELIKPALAKQSPVISTVKTIETVTVTEENLKDAVNKKGDSKSSVLTEILKASGVLATEETDANENDIERQITQFTEIPNNTVTLTTNSGKSTNKCINNSEIQEFGEAVETDAAIQDHIVETVEEEQNEENCFDKENTVQLMNIIKNIEIEAHDVNLEDMIPQNDVNFDHQTVLEVAQDAGNYVILDEHIVETTQSLLETDQPQTTEEVVELMGTLDPETGMYSLKSSEEYELIANNQSQLGPSDSYVIEMESLPGSELDMPSLSN